MEPLNRWLKYMTFFASVFSMTTVWGSWRLLTPKWQAQKQQDYINTMRRGSICKLKVRTFNSNNLHAVHTRIVLNTLGKGTAFPGWNTSKGISNRGAWPYTSRDWSGSGGRLRQPIFHNLKSKDSKEFWNSEGVWTAAARLTLMLQACSMSLRAFSAAL